MHRAINCLQRIGLVLLMALFINACSSGFLYERIPRLALWEFDNFVELNSEQEDHFLVLAREVLDEQRSEHFDVYIGWLDRINGAIASNELTQELLLEVYDEFVVFRAKLLDTLAPRAADFLLSLSSDQHDEFLQNLRENLDKDVAEYQKMRAEQGDEERVKKRQEGAEEQFGSLSDEQRELIAEYAKQQIDSSAGYDKYRYAWLDGFSEALKAADRERLIDVMVNYKQFYSEEYRVQRDANRALSFRSFAELTATLSDKQRGEIAESLNDWKADLAAIRDY